MLLLDRKPGTAVIIETSNGEKIKVSVIAKDQYSVKLGFQADPSVKILREEIIYEKGDGNGR